MQTWKRAQKMQVVTRDEGAIIGVLNDFQFDLATHEVYGYRLKGGVFSRAGGLAATDMLMIGRDVAFARSEQSVEWSGAGRNQAKGRAWSSEYRGTSAVDQRGRSMGSVSDFVIDAKGSHITGLILAGNRLLPLDARVQTGPAAVVAEDTEQLLELPAPEEAEGETWWGWLKESLAGRKEAAEDVGRPQLEAKEPLEDEEADEEASTWPPPPQLKEEEAE